MTESREKLKESNLNFVKVLYLQVISVDLIMLIVIILIRLATQTLKTC